MTLFEVLVKSGLLIWSISQLVNVVESSPRYYGSSCSCPAPQPCPPCPEEPCPCPTLPPCSCPTEILPLPTRKWPVKPVTELPGPPTLPPETKPTPITKLPTRPTRPTPTKPELPKPEWPTQIPRLCKRFSYRKVGCFKKPENLSKFLKKYVKKTIGRPKYWGLYVLSLACNCSRIALNTEGRGFFAINYHYNKKSNTTYGECWTGIQTYSTIMTKREKSKKCVNLLKRRCHSRNKHCIGKGKSVMLLQAKRKEKDVKEDRSPPACDIAFKDVGCFDDDMKNPRPLEHYFFTDKPHGDHMVEWGAWDRYLPDLACRCAEMASAEKKYDYFGIQDFSQCWAGGLSYNRSGMSGACVTKGYRTCNTTLDKKQLCVGRNHTNFVYKIDRQEDNFDLDNEDIQDEVHNHDENSDGDDDEEGDEDDDSANQRDNETNNNDDNRTTKDDEEDDDDDEKHDDSEDKNDKKEEAKEPDVDDTDDHDDQPHAIYDSSKEKVVAINISPLCELSYENLGCYGDKYASTRPLPMLMIRDDMEEPYKRTINTPNLACRCARMAHSQGFTHFGLKHNGECWSGPQAAYSYHIDGHSPNCITTTQCVGQRNANCVYRLA